MWSKHVLWNSHWTNKNLKIIVKLRKEKNKKEIKRSWVKGVGEPQTPAFKSDLL